MDCHLAQILEELVRDQEVVSLERKVIQEFHGRNIGTAKTLSLQNQGNISHVNIQFKTIISTEL